MSGIVPSALKVVELRAELSRRGLPQKGKKDELIARLTEAIEAEKKSNDTEQPEEQQEHEKTNQEESAEEETIAVEHKDEDTNEKDTVAESAPADEPENEQKDGEDAVMGNAPVEEEAASNDQPENKEKNDENKETSASTLTAANTTSSDDKDKEEKKESVPASIPTESNELAEEVDKNDEQQDTANDQKDTQPIKTEEKDVVTKEDDVAMRDVEAKQQAAAAVSMSPPKTDSNSAIGKKRRLSVDFKTEAEEGKRTKISNQDDVTSSAMYVKGFVRPLVLKHVEDLFKRYGKVTRLWMDSIKTHCYVIYENESDAFEAARSIDGIVFPPDTGKELTVGGLTPEQAGKLIEHEKRADQERRKVDWEACIQKVKSGEDLVSANGSPADRRIRQIGIGQVARELNKANAGDNALTTPSLTPLVAASNSGRMVQVVGKVEPEVEPKRIERSLDELFRKTKALPQLYYLPNTDEEAKVKLEQLRQRA